MLKTTAIVDTSEYKDCGIAAEDHFIGLITPGVRELSNEDVYSFVLAFKNAQKGDWFYCITLGDQKVFVEHNGELGYTMLLPEEH